MEASYRASHYFTIRASAAESVEAVRAYRLPMEKRRRNRRPALHSGRV